MERGRSVSWAAYAWYARARQLDRLGQLDLARSAYEEVLDADPKSGAAWAGLAATYCSSDPDRARATFEKGLRRAVETLPLLLAQARCELAWGKPHLALASARQAFLIDPASSEASTLLIQALAATGELETANRIERGQRLYRGGTEYPATPVANEGAVDLALMKGDLARAEALSLEVMTRSTLAVRALALGHEQYAAEQAALVHAAAPGETVAWAILHLTGKARSEPPDQPGDLGTLLTCLWAERLRADVGPAPVMSFLDALGGMGGSSTLKAWQTDGDPLLAACATRLERFTSAPL